MRSIAACTLTLLVVLIASCRQGEQTTYNPKTDPLVNPSDMLKPIPANAAEMAKDQTIYRFLAGSPSTLAPIFWSSRYDDIAQTPLFDGLVTFDKDFKWIAEPNMVESYEESPDHKTWTFKLKPGLKWHDGAPLTAGDFAFSWQVLIDDKVPAFTFRDDALRLQDVRAIDDRTVQIVHKEALPINKWVNSFPIIPKHLYDNPAERAKDPTMKQSPYYTALARDKVVGNGPYKLVEWVSNERIVLERWDGYAGEKPYWKRIVMKIQPDPNTALQLFKKSELDELGVTPQQFVFETNDPAFRRIGNKAWAETWTYSAIEWNMDGSNEFFNARNVRIAMAQACNLPYILEHVGYNLHTPCYGIFAPGSWMFNKEIKLLPYDLNKAASLLDQAGWKRSEQDGMRYKTVGGKPVKFDFELLMGQGSQVGPQIAAIYAEDLKKIGVSMRIREVEAATFLGMLSKHEYQASLGGWGTGVYPDTSENIWKTEMYKNGRNFGGYSNKRVDELFSLATREFSDQKRTQYFQEIQKLIYDDQPSLFIWNLSSTAVVNKKIHGVQFSPRGLFGFSPSYYKWWVAAGESLH